MRETVLCKKTKIVDYNPTIFLTKMNKAIHFVTKLRNTISMRFDLGYGENEANVKLSTCMIHKTAWNCDGKHFIFNGWPNVQWQAHILLCFTVLLFHIRVVYIVTVIVIQAHIEAEGHYCQVQVNGLRWPFRSFGRV